MGNTDDEKDNHFYYSWGKIAFGKIYLLRVLGVNGVREITLSLLLVVVFAGAEPENKKGENNILIFVAFQQNTNKNKCHCTVLLVNF